MRAGAFEQDWLEKQKENQQKESDKEFAPESEDERGKLVVERQVADENGGKGQKERAAKSSQIAAIGFRVGRLAGHINNFLEGSSKPVL